MTNIASGTSTQVHSIVDKGGIPVFIKTLFSKLPDIAEQAIWAIGNIAGDSTSYRDLILKAGGIPPLIKILANPDLKLASIKVGTWALSNCCRGKPLPEFKLV